MQTITGVKKYKINTVKHFHVEIEGHAANGHSFVDLYLDEAQGRFTASLFDGESYTYRFDSTGMKFVKFIIGIFENEPSYLYGKIKSREKEQMCNVTETIKRMKKELLESRKERVIDSEDARYVFDLLVDFELNSEEETSWDNIYGWYYRNPEVEMFFGEEIHHTDLLAVTHDEECHIFCHMVAPILANVLKDAYKRELEEFASLPDREERVRIVNRLIYYISERGRRFFETNENVAFMKLKNGNVYFVDDYTKQEVRVLDNGKGWNGFSHGGTLRALVLDFAHFIRTGEYSNGKNGYGGLHSNGWGHDDDVQREIIEYAKEIGYLRKEEAE